MSVGNIVAGVLCADGHAAPDLTAASAAVARISAFMLWITPLRDAPPTK